MPETGAIKFDGYLSQHCIRYTHVQINNSINTVTCTIITELIAASEQKKTNVPDFRQHLTPRWQNAFYLSSSEKNRRRKM
jgi:hypothetical protein